MYGHGKGRGCIPRVIVVMNGGIIKVVKYFKYMGNYFSKDGGVQEDVKMSLVRI